MTICMTIFPSTFIHSFLQPVFNFLSLLDVCAFVNNDHALLYVDVYVIYPANLLFYLSIITMYFTQYDSITVASVFEQWDPLCSFIHQKCKKFPNHLPIHFICQLINAPHINTGFPQSHQQAWPWIPTVFLSRTFIPGENISAGETQWTKPAGIWHSLTFPLPLLYSLYIHLLVNTMMALHKSLDFF